MPIFIFGKIEGQWENRCHWLYRVLLFLTCGLFGGRGIRQTDFEQLARIMARIFHTEVCVYACASVQKLNVEAVFVATIGNCGVDRTHLSADQAASQFL